ncbi:MAG: cobalamin-binding protein [Mucilaginibacter sp.]|uniref:cobalamin-binding protein n=1 Tax=Mucilaginibacter sp. TaxID=1882438 RepID=UPI0032636B70
MTNQKIISLLPAATEIICALGLEQNLVGRSHECDYPDTVKDLPICSEAKFMPGSSSLEIDKLVKETLTHALSIYTVNKELIKSLDPDVVITQTQCDVCAVSLKDVEEALENLLEKEVEIISLEPNNLDHIFADIKLIAAELDAKQQGDLLIELMEERIDIIRHKLKFITDKPTVACIEWIEPLMLAGNWTPELVDIAGGSSILTQTGKHSPYVDWDDIRLQNPDIIVVMPCGFSIERSMKEMSILLALPGFDELKAVKNNRLYITDGNQYFNRSGPRIIDSIEILAEIINPKQFIFGYEGEGWIKFSV